MNPSIEIEVLKALRRVMRATDLEAKRLARQTGLTTSQLIVLDTVGSAGELTVGAIAARVGLAQGTVTTMIDRLEQRGLVTRKRSDTDRRQVNVRVTVEGQRLLDSAPTLLQTRFLEKFAALRDWQKHSLLAALQQLADLMDAQDLDASPVLDVGSIDRAPE